MSLEMFSKRPELTDAFFSHVTNEDSERVSPSRYGVMPTSMMVLLRPDAIPFLEHAAGRATDSQLETARLAHRMIKGQLRDPLNVARSKARMTAVKLLYRHDTPEADAALFRVLTRPDFDWDTVDPIKHRVRAGRNTVFESLVNESEKPDAPLYAIPVLIELAKDTPNRNVLLKLQRVLDAHHDDAELPAHARKLKWALQHVQLLDPGALVYRALRDMFIYRTHARLKTPAQVKLYLNQLRETYSRGRAK